MAERNRETARAMQSPRFRVTICDLHDTIETAERKVKQLDPVALFDLKAGSEGFCFQVNTNSLSIFDIADVVDDQFIDFEDRIGLSIYSTLKPLD